MRRAGALILAVIGGIAVGERLRFRLRKLKSQPHDLVGQLAIVIEYQYVIGFGGELLLGGPMPAPINRLIEKLNYLR